MTQQKVPSCFGAKWEARAPECAGGLDPAYMHPVNGSNKRDRCPWYSQCAASIAAQKMSTQGGLVQVRPQQQQQQQQQIQPPSAMKPFFTQQPPQMQPQQPQPQQMVPAPYMVPPQQAQTPYMVPMNFAPQSAQMPGYLTVPEPIVPGQHWGKRLGFSIARSMAKAAGHTLANFFDHTPLNPWYPQG